jgi:predicted anti-sigma-YlaC factor YlaD
MCSLGREGTGMQRTACPSRGELAAFNLGDLPETLLDEIADHLEECPRCEAAARDLDGVVDPALELLRAGASTARLPPPGPAGGRPASPRRSAATASSASWAAAAWASSTRPGTSRCGAWSP